MQVEVEVEGCVVLETGCGSRDWLCAWSKGRMTMSVHFGAGAHSLRARRRALRAFWGVLWAPRIWAEFNRLFPNSDQLAQANRVQRLSSEETVLRALWAPREAAD